VDGFDLLTYRYTGDAPRLLREVVRATHLPVVSAGSIASFERIDEVWETGAWGFTIGSAFFEQRFVSGGPLRDNIAAVASWLERGAAKRANRIMDRGGYGPTGAEDRF
jgi:phosphoribosylformimino-5-aminoimidazole carboxamide ribonucleotide (ProFAR) isomerase